jgi:Ca2+-transporting ATPase
MTPDAGRMQEPPQTAAWHALASEALVRELQTALETGLADPEARRRLAQHGPNELPAVPTPSPLTLFLRQFASLVIWVLIAAAVVSGFLHEWVDTGAILAIVLLNAVLGFVQEHKAERALASLKRLSITTARVVREGIVRVIPAREVAPGDLIQIEAGDRVPADARLVYETGLRSQEAALTGESAPVDKTTAPLDGTTALADRTNMVFLGTAIASGKGRAVVVATGLGTELGRIATLMRATGPEETPLQKRLERFGVLLLYLALGIVTAVFVLGLLRGEPLIGMFLTAVSLAVAAIPEGLPAIVTITLALGVTRMVHRHALIRRLPAVETLGSTTVICTDKTGTLTKNEMTVTRLHIHGGTYEVTGEGYEPVGEVREVNGQGAMVNGGRSSFTPTLSPGGRGQGEGEALRELLTAAVLCNGATLSREDGVWRVVGDPTEGALLVAAAKMRLLQAPLEAAHPMLGEAPFDSERKMMTMVRRADGRAVAYVKGAPDVLLRRCTRVLARDGAVAPLTEPIRQEIAAANRAFAHEALRVLGLARRPLASVPSTYRADELERDLVFLGLAAMKDPLRHEAIEAVARCRRAGIRTVMITGDHKDTAAAIARELGLLDEGGRALSGAELDAMTDHDLAGQAGRIAVYARVTAEHKLRIVRAWKARGAVVAMTGDGVNDAPAIKAADIGVAMGITGTDVTKEASDMVVTDDNFASIAAAVEEGRAIYDNILKAIHYLLSCNMSEVLLMLFAVLLALPLPLLPVQILWINLVSDGLPALALAVDPKAPDLMERRPRRSDEPFLTPRRLTLLLGEGLLMALLALLAFWFSLGPAHEDLDHARTTAFTVMVFAQLFHVFNCRSDRHSLFTLGLGTNRPLLWAVGGSALLQAAILLHPAARDVFKAAPFDPEHWVLAVGLGLLPLVAMEVWKAVKR